MRNLMKTEIDELYKNRYVILHLENDITIEGKLISASEEFVRIMTNNDEDVVYYFKNIKDFECFPHELGNKNYESNDKMVSRPPHYQSATGLEVIDVIEAFTAELKGIEAADTANVIKYICRWNSKNGLQDLKKAMWYLTHLINHVEKSEKECN